jgi:hypothetical protein
MDLAAISAFGRIFDELNPEEKDEIQGKATESGLVHSLGTGQISTATPVRKFTRCKMREK